MKALILNPRLVSDGLENEPILATDHGLEQPASEFRFLRNENYNHASIICLDMALILTNQLFYPLSSRSFINLISGCPKHIIFGGYAMVLELFEFAAQRYNNIVLFMKMAARLLLLNPFKSIRINGMVSKSSLNCMSSDSAANEKSLQRSAEHEKSWPLSNVEKETHTGQVFEHGH